jgi:sugar O-acyltransferase (sialic acid O-acetyltransferase NeuD family)
VPHRIVVVGTGGMGREAAAWAADAWPGARLLGFLDDRPEAHGSVVADLPVLGGVDWLDDPARRDVEVVPAVGVPRSRAALLARLDEAGARLATLVHPTVHLGPRTRTEPGVIVSPGVFLSCDVHVDAGAIVNYGAMVGHDGRIGASSFVGPGVHLAGGVTVGALADVGIGATVIQGVEVGEQAVVGAGAVVIRDVQPHTTVVGVPARPIRGASA